MAFKNKLHTKGFTLAGTGLAAMLLNYLFTDDFTALKNLGVGAVLGIEAGKVLLATVPNFVAKFAEEFHTLKNFDINHDLEQAYITAYERAISRIEKDLFEAEELERSSALRPIWEFLTANPSEQTVLKNFIHEYFFDKLLVYFTDAERLKMLIQNNRQLTFESYVEQAFLDTRLTDSFRTYYTETLTPDHLKTFFKERFIKYFPQEFSQALKHDDKAKTAYFKSLLELILSELTVMKKDLAEIKQGQQSTNETLNILRNLAVRSNNDLTSIIEERRAFDQQTERLDELLQLYTELQVDVHLILKKLESQKCWIPNLVLDIQERNSDRTNILEYRTQYMSFVGRAVEKSSVFDMLDDPRDFCWGMLEGPGGSGKSRLALECCLIAKAQGYYAGFYRLDRARFPDDDRKIGEELPLFIVVDYAMADPGKANELITYFQEKISTNKEYGLRSAKIRILLIDRRFDNLLEKSPLLKNSYFQKDLLPIRVDKEDDIRWSVFRDVISQHEGDNRNELLNTAELEKSALLSTLDKLDKEQRPLFAFLAAEAFITTDGKDVASWTSEGLLSATVERIKRVRHRYKAYTEFAYYIDRLFLINTICRELSKADINTALRSYSELTPPQLASIKDLYHQLADHVTENGAVLYTGIQPDLVGGYIILNFLQQNIIDDPGQLTQVNQQAWKLRPDRIYWTWSLFLEDYFYKPEYFNTEIAKMVFIDLEDLITSANCDKVARSYYSLIVTWIKVAKESQIAHEQVLVLFGKLKKILNAFPDNATVVECYLEAMLYMIPVKDLLKNIKGDVEDLLEIPDPPITERSLAIISHCLMRYSISVIPLEKQLAINDKLTEIHSRQPDNFYYSAALAGALSHLIILTPSPEAYQPYLKTLSKLYEQFGEDLAFPYSKALTEVLEHGFSKPAALKELRSIYQAYPTNEDLAKLLTSAICKVLMDDDLHSKARRSYYREAQKLRRSFRNGELDNSFGLVVVQCLYFAETVKEADFYYAELSTLFESLVSKESGANAVFATLEALVMDGKIPERRIAYLNYLAKIAIRDIENYEAPLVRVLLNEITGKDPSVILPCYDLFNNTWEINRSSVVVARGMAIAAAKYTVTINPINKQIYDRLLQEIHLVHEAFPNDEFIAQNFSVVLAHGAAVLNEAPDEDRLIILEDLYTAFPKNTGLADQLLLAHSLKSNFQQLLALLERLNANIPDHDSIAMKLAEFLILSSYDSKKPPLDAQGFKRIDDLILQVYVQDEDLAINAAEFYGSQPINADEDEKADLILSRIRALGSAFPGNVEIAGWLSGMLINQLASTEDIEAKKGMMQELEKLSDRFPDSRLVALRLAGAYLHLLEEDVPDQLPKYSDNILRIQRSHPTDLDIARVAAESLSQLMLSEYYTLSGENALRLTELNSEFPDDPEIALFCANTYRLLAEKNEGREFLNICCELVSTYARDFPDDSAINLEYMITTGMKLMYESTAEDPISFDQHFSGMKALYLRFYKENQSFVPYMGRLLAVIYSTPGWSTENKESCLAMVEELVMHASELGNENLSNKLHNLLLALKRNS